MSDRDVADAEGIMKMRAISVLVMAGTVVFMSLIAFRAPTTLEGLLTWSLVAITDMICLTGVARGGILNRRAVRLLVEDETTRGHRRTSQQVGFWAAMASGLIVMIVALFVPLPAEAAIRIVLTASLCAALIAFGTLEWTAARSG